MHTLSYKNAVNSALLAINKGNPTISISLSIFD